MRACPAVSTVGNLDGELDPGEASHLYGELYTLDQADVDNGSVVNVADGHRQGPQRRRCDLTDGYRRRWMRCRIRSLSHS